MRVMARVVQGCIALTILLTASRVNAAELVAHWPMDDVKDGALFGNGVQTVVEGIAGKALEFKPEGNRCAHEHAR